jgi:hypothetical protein
MVIRSPEMEELTYIPLEIIWSRVTVLLFGAEGTYISRGIMDQTMPQHLVLTFKSVAAHPAGTSFHTTKKRPVL